MKGGKEGIRIEYNRTTQKGTIFHIYFFTLRDTCSFPVSPRSLLDSPVYIYSIFILSNLKREIAREAETLGEREREEQGKTDAPWSLASTAKVISPNKRRY
mmetsp:Transcript_5364/g.8142  ORF Transcript_5364/g.8142 Transcript_5364/m.8142 type:complete len:101 (-) Transcript_5364:1369-1671(-)